MQKNIVFTWSLVIALGGFLFGFDTAVISGAEKAIQEYWTLGVFEHGLTVSIALIGTVVGALVGAYPSDKFGRKKTLFIIAALYLFSALGTALATDWFVFLVFRFLGGVGVGISSVTAPIYISEIAPAKSRGKLVGLFQFNIVFGILIAFLSNYLIGTDGANNWRWMLGIQAFPSILFYILLFVVPESPRWLILNKNRNEEAIAILKRISPIDYQKEYDSIVASSKGANDTKSGDPLFQKKYSAPITLAILFAVFNQVSGINAIIYYAPRIFEMAGFGAHTSLLSSVGIGLVNFTFTLIAINFIDRVGRKTLMYVGTVGLVLSLGLVANTFFQNDLSGFAISIYLMMYIAFFAFSQGAVIWVFISEIFPNEVRAKGQTLGSFTHWIMAAIIAFVFPYLAEQLGGGITFAFFTVMMAIQFIFVWKMMPETKGKSLEQIDVTVLGH
ncbi:sugar porter family MFS transporter [Pedobacter sp. UBA4863]|uniref:sugar porter family MFS transporter n=1 Tax=Pedobacter sp. UBA4863 TaxID=1947060 RepID=UPI0025E5F0AF|nr:sugar porter family MFS transporter [Pedobacter sp. UBA4863]